MIIKKTKKTGSALIITLVIMLFLSFLGASNFNLSKTNLNMSNNIYSSNLRFQASEKSINAVWEEQLSSPSGINEIINFDSGSQKTFCWDQDKVKTNDGCDNAFLNKDKTITSKAVLTGLSGVECLSYGNSDQRAYCYEAAGTGDVPLLDNPNRVHIQEIQINLVNASSNGVYEF